jgi:undecaprenyl-phosphate 4-deoxy-4-formamido-L-arabinose transferase
MKISAVVPVFNSGANLKELHERLSRVLISYDGYEIIFVEDCGKDASWEVLRGIAKSDPRVRAVRLSRNYGQHNALLCGIRLARHETIITLDDDLQHPPEEIPRLLVKLNEGYDVVYGAPLKERHGFWRDLASWITKLALQSVMGATIARNVSAFRAFRTPLREAFVDYKSPYVSIDVLLTWGTASFAAITVPHENRKAGSSNYTFGRLVAHAFNMMTGFSTWPLQIAGLTGFVFTLFGLGVFLYVVGRYFIQGCPVPGFPFLSSIIAIFAGAQLFALGIIGEYLARMHFRTMERPAYVIKESL